MTEPNADTGKGVKCGCRAELLLASTFLCTNSSKCDYPRLVAECEGLRKELFAAQQAVLTEGMARNAAEAELGEYKQAVKANWWQIEPTFGKYRKATTCQYCFEMCEQPDEWDQLSEPAKFDHAPDCIVRRV